ncbi:MAG: TlpA family protein disulfide reductase [Spirochaetes bacterium]|nr:MAG: TlpA family protein disulfide reductase [Spirochaetota bacterium]
MRNRLTAFFMIAAIALWTGLADAQTAPGFALENDKGTMVFRSSLKGNLIISFFASYCKPCEKDVPLLVELEKKYGKTKNLTLILITADLNDGEGKARDKAAGFMKKIGVSHDFLLDVYHVAISKYNPQKSLPSTFLVDQNGNMPFQEIGFREDTMTRLEQAIGALP